MTAETFDFDTSGAVEIPNSGGQVRRGRLWSDLPNDFVRGYIRAALQPCEALHYSLTDRFAAFSDLHPDTLESMLADCASFRPVEGSEPDDVKRVKGGMFWRYRQDGAYAADGFPPLRLSLDPQGKVIAHG